MEWAKIVSIKGVGEKQTFDIEIETTHNFVGNEIVAHNTYISGNLGIGTGNITPVGALDVAADYGISLRAGLGAAQFGGSGDNDLHLAAEDAVSLNAGDLTVTSSEDSATSISISAARGGVSLSSSSASGSGDIRILSGGTLRLSTSANNSNILVQAGSGNINLSSTGTITLTGNTSLNNGTLRLNGITYTFPGADSANGVLLSNGSGSLSWTTLGASSITADSLDSL